MTKVLTVGVFDYFHLGHLRLFKKCREYGDYLIVSAQEGDYIDRIRKPTILYTTDERIEILKSLRPIDEVITHKKMGPDFLKDIDFDVFAVGEDQLHQGFIDAIKWCEENGKKVVRIKRTPNICSSDIKRTLQ